MSQTATKHEDTPPNHAYVCGHFGPWTIVVRLSEGELTYCLRKKYISVGNADLSLSGLLLAIDTYVTEAVNLDLKRWARRAEKNIRELAI